MAVGLRIYHPELRNAVIQVPIPAKTDRGTAKNVQVVVDDSGHATVSEGVWQELEFATINGAIHNFIIINEVIDPPTLELGRGQEVGRDTYLVEREALKQIAPAGVNARVVNNGFKNNLRSN